MLVYYFENLSQHELQQMPNNFHTFLAILFRTANLQCGICFDLIALHPQVSILVGLFPTDSQFASFVDEFAGAFDPISLSDQKLAQKVQLQKLQQLILGQVVMQTWPSSEKFEMNFCDVSPNYIDERDIILPNHFLFWLL